MPVNLLIPRVLIIFICFKSIVCLQTVLTKNNEKSHLMAKLLNVMNTRNFEKRQLYHVKKKMKNIGKKDLEDIFSKGVVVKPFVPVAYPLNYEYNENRNTLNRPLIRFLKVKPRANYPKERKIFEKRSIKTPIFNDRNYLYKDEDLLQLFSIPRKVTFRSILDDVVTYTSKLQSDAEIRRLKYAILGILENYPKALLRHKFATGSDERAQMHVMTINDNNGQPTEKPKKKKPLPDYPFWNYWTYDKTIYQDKCKGNLVQLGNYCVETPPH